MAGCVRREAKDHDPELTALAFAGLLQVAHHVPMSVRANIELVPSRTLGPRDERNLRARLTAA